MTARRISLLVGFMVATLALFAPTAFADGDRRVHHSGRFWAWDGPRGYVGSPSANGITITGPNGATLDTGFSSTICSNGATWAQSVTNYFNSKRQGLRQSGFTLSNVSNIVHPRGTPELYRRQRMSFTVQSGGVTKQGELTFDYSFNTNVDGLNYCYARNLGIYSNRNVFGTVRPTLIAINNSLVYFGPGACTPSPTTPC